MAARAPRLGHGGGVFALPVSGLEVALRPPTGREELILLETADDDLAALSLAGRLGPRADGPEVDWAQLTPTDLDAFVLRLRQARLGDRVVSHVGCGAEGCAARIDLSFGIEAYLDFHRPRAPRAAPAADPERPGWLRLGSEPGALFRLPTMVDLMAARSAADPPAALARTCLPADARTGRARRRLEAAMTALAPPLSSELAGACPECGAAIAATFEPRRYCLRELRERARFLYEDVDLLASRHHWSEDSILALPVARRQAYVELALSAAA